MINNKRLIELALSGLEMEKQRIQNEIDSLRKQTGTTSVAKTRKKTTRKSRLTPEGRKKLSESMKARWAARRAAAGAAAKKPRRKAA